MFLLGFILHGSLYTSQTWVAVSFPMLGKFLTIISLNIFSDHFFSLLLLGLSISNVSVFIVVAEFSGSVFNFFHSFFFLNPVPWPLFPHCVFHFTFSFLCLSYSAIHSF